MIFLRLAALRMLWLLSEVLRLAVIGVSLVLIVTFIAVLLGAH